MPFDVVDVNTVIERASGDVVLHVELLDAAGGSNAVVATMDLSVLPFMEEPNVPVKSKFPLKGARWCVEL